MLNKWLNQMTEKESPGGEFKYIMQDTGNIYLGAKYSYEELLEEEMLAFKIKTVITHYIAKESALDNTLESDFYYLKEDTFLYQIYTQLKVKVKVSVKEVRKPLIGKEKSLFQEYIYTLKQLVEMDSGEKGMKGLVIQEIIFPKLALLSFAV